MTGRFGSLAALLKYMLCLYKDFTTLLPCRGITTKEKTP